MIPSLPVHVWVNSTSSSSGKTFLTCFDKIDALSLNDNANIFFELGLGDPVPISASHGRNIGEMLDVVIEKLPNEKNKFSDGNENFLERIGK